MRAIGAMVAGMFACGGSQQPPLGVAGSDTDEGAGELARASLRLHTPAGAAEGGFTDRERGRAYANPYGGDPYGGAPYGGASYAGWQPPQWSMQAPTRSPSYLLSVGLPGAIEGTVSWGGAPPAKLTTPCGLLDNPTLRASAERRLRGVLVYIEKIDAGRMLPYYTRPISVGGMLAKRGCLLVPAAQIVTPLPGGVAIQGDAQRATVRIVPATGDPTVGELQEGGLVQTAIAAGVTRIEGADGRLGAAWVLGLDTPYYAITDDHGRYRIDELASGTYQVTFWQPPVASVRRDGTWSYGAPIVVRRSVTVDAGTAALSVTLTGR